MDDTQLINYQPNLPAKMDDLAKFVLFGREKLVSVRAEIRAMDKLDVAKEVREQKRDEAQMLAGALLDAESKIGEIIKRIPKDNPEKANRTQGRIASVKELGFTQKQSEQFQRLAENPEIVEQVKAEAIENDDLPTRTEVLRKVKELKREVQIQDIKAKIQTENLTINDKYDVISIDPPWEYGREYDPQSSRVASPYPEMSTIEIMNIELPLKDNAIVFLWTTHAFLRDAFDILDAWQLEYKATIVWDKEKMGIGNNLRMQCEFCLFATKGRPLIQGKSERDIIREPRREHSRKPDAFYEMVSRLTDGRKLDYFSREKRIGWDSYGIESDLF